MLVRAGVGRSRFLRRGARGDGGKIKTEGDGRRSGEQRTPCRKRRGRRGIFIIMGQRQGTPGWVDDLVRGQTGQT